MKMKLSKARRWLAVLATALVVPVAASDARIEAPAGGGGGSSSMQTNAANAVLPDALIKFGVPVTVGSYGAKCDALSYTNDGAIAAGSNQFTSSNVTTALAGKTILLANAGGTLSINNFNTATAIAGAGSGYAVNDTITLAGGTGTAAIVKVTSIGAAGAVTGFTVTNFGSYTLAPANPVAQGSTSGSGTGFTVSIGWWGNPLTTTISSVSGTTATLAATATSTLAAASGTNSYWLVGTDDTAAIQATINAAETISATPANTTVSFQAAGQNCLISSTLSITGHGVRLAGNGAVKNENYPHYNYLSGMTEPATGTTLVWVGASGGTMLDREPASGGAPLKSGGIDGIGFACESLAATAVRIASSGAGQYPSLRLENCIGHTLDLEDSANVSPASIDVGTQQNHFGTITISNKTPLTQSSVGIMLNGAAGRGNASGNTFDNVRGANSTGQLIDCVDADANWFGHVWGGTVTLDAGGAAPGCFSNYFAYVEPGTFGTLYARGTETGSPASLSNFVAAYSTNNGGPAEPTCGTAAGLMWGKPEASDIRNCSGSLLGGGTGITQLTGGVTAGPGSGAQAATVVTNANLTGPVTSTGNATAFASMTGNAFLTGNGTALPNQVAITGLVKGNGASAPGAYAGTSCTNQFPRSLDLNGAATCASVANADLANSSVTIAGHSVSLGGTQTLASTDLSDSSGLARLATAESFTKAQRGTPSNIAISTATFTPNFDNSQNFEVDLTSACPCTLANPSTSLVAGQSGMIEVHQDGSGSRTIGTWGSDYQYVGGTSTITLSTAASAVDYLPYYVNNAATGIVLGTLIKAPAH